jgi:hypothetical protein
MTQNLIEISNGYLGVITLIWVFQFLLYSHLSKVSFHLLTWMQLYHLHWPKLTLCFKHKNVYCFQYNRMYRHRRRQQLSSNVNRLKTTNVQSDYLVWIRMKMVSLIVSDDYIGTENTITEIMQISIDYLKMYTFSL